MSDYASFLERKIQYGEESGFDPVYLPDFLFDFQKALVEWAVRKGRCALFEDCGLGKSIQGIVWAENVVRKTGGRVLLLTPLAVGHQFITECQKFGVDADVHRSLAGELHDGIVIANYERLHYFNPQDFVGIVCDESSILKSFDGRTRSAVTEFARQLPYRLLATATAAPNDYIELGTSSEALGELGYMDMLNRFFKNDSNNSATGRGHMGEIVKWRFKGHAEEGFWRWVSSWARAARKPSDVGFDDGRFVLPALVEQEHVVEAETLANGMLFALPAVGLDEQREERKRTIVERCNKVASLVTNTKEPALVWCHLNDEGDLLEKMIPDAVQVSGRDSDDSKEEKLLAFARGETRVLVTKPKIGAWGLNLQHCAHVTFFPSHSYEQYYQGVRRCWRFGQTRPVVVDVVTTEGEREVMKNLQRKASQADRMFSSLVAQMNNALRINRSVSFDTPEIIPSWLS
jgi:SNF2 family DNA or RNA helicase